ncbi:MAG: hypothetical protein M0R80_00795 [Proteobacteria bacterium]|nr:hypothetical protein [Pseudomonadota bacterium]
MNFNADTRFSDLDHNLLIAKYRDREGNLSVIYSGGNYPSKYVVVSFNKYNYCNNAAGYISLRDAWKLFVEIVQEDLNAAVT